MLLLPTYYQIVGVSRHVRITHKVLMYAAKELVLVYFFRVVCHEIADEPSSETVQYFLHTCIHIFIWSI